MAHAVKGSGSRGEGDPVRVFVLSSPGELARAAAGRLWGIAKEMPEGRTVHIALSGGETPRRAYGTLAADPYRARFPWGRVRFWQVDERFVPPGDPRSNRRMIEETLLSRAPVPEEGFRGVDTALPGPDEAAREYEAVLRRAFPDAPGGIPRFDAVVLGVGKDGHTASLFPGSGALSSARELVGTSTGGDPPVSRVTMTLSLLNAASRIVFLVQGGGKARVLHDVIAAARDPALRSPALPASLVAPRRGSALFLADAEAARLLPPEWRTAG